MKKYKVCGFSDLMDAEMNCHTIEQASDLYEMMMNSDFYYKGHIMDNETGELYCHFSRRVEHGGVTVEYWTAFE